VLKNRGGATIRYDSFEHVQNSRGLSRSMPISGDRLRFVPNHGDAVTNVLRMYHGLPRFLKSWTIGTKDRDSTCALLVLSPDISQLSYPILLPKSSSKNDAFFTTQSTILVLSRIRDVYLIAATDGSA